MDYKIPCYCSDEEEVEWLYEDTKPVPEVPDSELSMYELGKKYEELFGNCECVLIDIDGTLLNEDKDNVPFPGVIEAVEMLRDCNLKLIFVTNTALESRKMLQARLKNLGISCEIKEIFTSLYGSRKIVDKLELNPYYLVNENAMEEFDGVMSYPNCFDSVLIGIATTSFDYRLLNKALLILLEGKSLVGAHAGKFTNEELDGIRLGPGPFISSLEFACDQEPMIVAKPLPGFFKSILDETDTQPVNTVMIGDDVYDDIKGAKDVDLRTVLVKTGNYLLLDKDLKASPALPQPDYLSQSFADAIRAIVAAVGVREGKIVEELPEEEEETKVEIKENVEKFKEKVAKYMNEVEVNRKVVPCPPPPKPQPKYCSLSK